MNEETLFVEALQHEHAERASFLDEKCQSDKGLRERVEKLLAAHDRSEEFLAKPAIKLDAGTATSADFDLVDPQIGPYKLREKIGEGGFGVVYVAEQKEPVSRKVALKVIKPGMDSKEIIARFEAERQALAMMDHPNVARFFDAGVTGDRTLLGAAPAGPSRQEGRVPQASDVPLTSGRVPLASCRRASRLLGCGLPYFVMELVQGVPITEFCDSKKLTNRQRLELFIDVCHAVQHAHQKGIIHRDIKPSNVMVTMADHKAVVKVIDFGVAKALHQDLTDKSIYTAYGQMIGTPMYMSPEQAQLNSLDIDTRSDIYSLGVLLYELLTGTTPFDKETFKKAGFDQMRRMIREVEPRRPSEQVSTLRAEQISTISESHCIDQRTLTKALRGDLDWIVMKALEKDRSRRYETANDLAADVQRYLKNEPISAMPPTVGYRLRKFINRNRVVATFTTAIFLLIAAGVIGLFIANTLIRNEQATTSLALDKSETNLKIAKENETKAELNLQRAREADSRTKLINDFFIANVVQAANPGSGSKDIIVRDAILSALEKVDGEFGNSEIMKSHVKAILETICSALGNITWRSSSCKLQLSDFKTFMRKQTNTHLKHCWIWQRPHVSSSNTMSQSHLQNKW